MSGMTERETLRYLTPMTAMMGFIGCIVTIIGAWLWPLV
jgi:GntP family gluconate:H+ symporter